MASSIESEPKKDSSGARGHVNENNKYSTDSLFYIVMCVSLKPHENKNVNSTQTTRSLESDKQAYILWQFPEKEVLTKLKITENVTEDHIPYFCFPDPDSDRIRKEKKTKLFQLIFTNIDGTRTYAFCLKLYSKSTVPLVYCIVSPVDASEMYNTILSEAERLHNESPDDCKAFLEALYSKKLPNRGESIEVSFGTVNIKNLKLIRNYDRRLDHSNLNIILNYSKSLIINIFGSILAEGKILFVSKNISLLSDVIQAFEILLYPFTWPHTIIPVLPKNLKVMLDSPTPYIIGLVMNPEKTISLKKLSKTENNEETEAVNDILKNGISYVFVVNLDERSKFIDRSNLPKLPQIFVDWMKKNINNVLDKKDSEKNEKLCELFLNFFVKTTGKYKKFIVSKKAYASELSSCKKDVEKKESINKKMIDEMIPDNEEKNEIEKFLAWFTKTQIFKIFISQKSTPNSHFGLKFDEAIDALETSAAKNKSEKANEQAPKKKGKTKK